jgi:hypothetical protein
MGGRAKVLSLAYESEIRGDVEVSALALAYESEI